MGEWIYVCCRIAAVDEMHIIQVQQVGDGSEMILSKRPFERTKSVLHMKTFILADRFWGLKRGTVTTRRVVEITDSPTCCLPARFFNQIDDDVCVCDDIVQGAYASKCPSIRDVHIVNTWGKQIIAGCWSCSPLEGHTTSIPEEDARIISLSSIVNGPQHVHSFLPSNSNARLYNNIRELLQTAVPGIW